MMATTTNSSTIVKPRSEPPGSATAFFPGRVHSDSWHSFFRTGIEVLIDQGSNVIRPPSSGIAHKITLV